MLAPVLTPTSQHPDSLVTIGRILKPFGVKGEVKVESMSDVPGRFESLEMAFITLPHQMNNQQEITITQVREIPEGYLMKCSAFSTPEEVAPYRGAWIQIPMNINLPRDPDTFYQFELIGLRVEDSDGQHMGTVKEIFDYPQHHVLVVRNEGQEFLIPAHRRTIKTVDLEKQCMYLTSNEWWDISHAV